MEIFGIESKWIVFFCIGIFTFFLSGYILRGIHPPTNAFLMLLVYWVLFGTGILAYKERSAGFVAKAFVISFMALLLISVGFFAWSAHRHTYSTEIDADRLDFVPEEFVVVTEEELNDYPALKEAIETQTYVKANPGEWTRTIEFLDSKGSSVIKVGDAYYQIGFTTA
ncbi:MULTISPECIES: hypothetical protein [Methanococcoides]|uniref:hypothetical protein n=1 Tax=Methanococcoides TaxID=2225 RepID=UPI00064F0C62|nr:MULTISPECIES: hypothetical protein [Methanococcoides]UGV39808.1 hypothetical protein J7W08_06640 [Methanococcoides orientis]